MWWVRFFFLSPFLGRVGSIFSIMWMLFHFSTWHDMEMIRRLKGCDEEVWGCSKTSFRKWHCGWAHRVDNYQCGCYSNLSSTLNYCCGRYPQCITGQQIPIQQFNGSTARLPHCFKEVLLQFIDWNRTPLIFQQSKVSNSRQLPFFMVFFSGLRLIWFGCDRPAETHFAQSPIARLEFAI